MKINPVELDNLVVGAYVTVLGPNIQTIDKSSFFQNPTNPSEYQPPIPDGHSKLIFPVNGIFLQMMGIPLLIRGIALPFVLCVIAGNLGTATTVFTVIDTRSITLAPLPTDYVSAFNMLANNATQATFLGAPQCNPKMTVQSIPPPEMQDDE